MGYRLKIDKSLGSNNKYRIHFYSFKEGNWIIDVEKNTSISGKLKIKYPELTVVGNHKNPVIWFVAYREDSKSGIKKNDDFDLAEDTDELIKILTHDSIAEVKIYPNPFQNDFIIQSPTDDEIIIQDITGKKIKTQKIKNGLTLITTDELTKGIYFVKCIFQAKNFKIIKL